MLSQMNEELYCLLTVVDREDGQKLLEPFKKECVRFNMAILAKGSATDELLNMLGLDRCEKVTIFSIIRESCKSKLLEMLLTEFSLNEAGKGIAFAIPISKIGGLKITSLSKDEEEESREKMQIDFKYELVIAVTSRGFAEDVVDAAKKVVQVGATIMNARGMGTKEIEKFFGITISPEKELVLMLALKKDTKEIMKSILKNAGPQTNAKAIAFSLPVSDMVGLPEHLYYKEPEGK